MTMDHTPEPPPPSSSPNTPIVDEAQLETLIRQTIAEQTVDVATIPNALPRLNARLDAAHTPKRWFGPFRLAGAVSIALILLALVTPVGRLAAANVTHGVQNAAQTVITTVKQIASRTNDSGTPPPQGTLPAPNATGAPASRAVPTNGVGSPASGTVANPSSVTRTGTPAGAASQIVPLSPTPTPRATNQPTATGTAVETTITTISPSIGARATSTSAPAAATTTALPTATVRAPDTAPIPSPRVAPSPPRPTETISPP